MSQSTRAPSTTPSSIPSLLHEAAEKGNQGVIQVMLAQKADINCTDQDGNTLLMAALNGYGQHENVLGTMQYLIDQKANPNQSNDQTEMTILHMAAGNGLDDIVRMLINNRADVSLRAGGDRDSPDALALAKLALTMQQPVLNAEGLPHCIALLGDAEKTAKKSASRKKRKQKKKNNSSSTTSTSKQSTKKESKEDEKKSSAPVIKLLDEKLDKPTQDEKKIEVVATVTPSTIPVPIAPAADPLPAPAKTAIKFNVVIVPPRDAKEKAKTLPQLNALAPSKIHYRELNPAAQYVLQQLFINGYIVGLTGGMVRDSWYEIKNTDCDVATNATTEQLQKLFSNCRIFRTPYREIVEVMIDHDSPIQIVTFCKTHNRYENSNHPGEDALTRDFSINAGFLPLGIDEELGELEFRELEDYSTTIQDLNNRVLRAIDLSIFTRDPVCILRGIRIAAKLGLTIADETRQAIIESKSSLTFEITSSSRLYKELEKIQKLSAGQKCMAYSLLEDYRLAPILKYKIDGSANRKCGPSTQGPTPVIDSSPSSSLRTSSARIIAATPTPSAIIDEKALPCASTTLPLDSDSSSSSNASSRTSSRGVSASPAIQGSQQLSFDISNRITDDKQISRPTPTRPSPIVTASTITLISARSPALTANNFRPLNSSHNANLVRSRKNH